MEELLYLLDANGNQAKNHVGHAGLVCADTVGTNLAFHVASRNLCQLQLWLQFFFYATFRLTKSGPKTAPRKSSHINDKI